MPDAVTPHYIHATAIVIGEAGVLVRGPSGSGKSSLALRLIAIAQGRGRFARLVGDDRVAIAAVNGVLVARPHPAVAGRIERRTLPLATLPYEKACVVRLVVDLELGPLPRLPDPAPSATLALVERPVLRLESPTSDVSCDFVLQTLAQF